MGKRIYWIFLAVSAAFFIFVVGLTGSRIAATRALNADHVRDRMPALVAQASSLHESVGGYDSPLFAQGMHAVFAAEPRLLLLSIYSPRGGIQYLVARNSSYLRDPAEPSPKWRGTPSYQSSGYETLVSLPIGGEPAGATLDALFVTIGREDLYPIIKDDLFLFLAFILVCGVLMLVFFGADQGSTAQGLPRAARPATPTASAVSPSAPAAPQKPAGSRRSEPECTKGILSPRSGLVWAEHLQTRLSAELERAAQADVDIVLVRLFIDGPTSVSQAPAVYAGIAQILKESFPLHDLLFETGSDSFTVLLPDIDLDAAIRALETFRQKVADTPFEGTKTTVSIGVSSRSGRLIEDNILLDEAEGAVAKARREGGNMVIGFRADPAKYREALSSLSS